MNYFELFISMSRKRLLSLDRINLEDPNDNIYYIVCMPSKIITLQCLFNLCKNNDSNFLNNVEQNIPLLDEIILL